MQQLLAASSTTGFLIACHRIFRDVATRKRQSLANPSLPLAQHDGLPADVGYRMVCNLLLKAAERKKGKTLATACVRLLVCRKPPGTGSCTMASPAASGCFSKRSIE